MKGPTTTSFTALAFGLAVVLPACISGLTLSRRKSADSFPQCSCSCCETEVQAHGPLETTFQCALIPEGDERFMSKFRAQRAGCPQYCRQSATDKVLTATHSPQIDYERFCYFECMPTEAKAGTICRKLDRKEQKEAADTSGNGMEIPVHSKPKVTAAEAAARNAALMLRAKAGARLGAAPWSSTKDPAPEVGTRAALEAKAAAGYRSRAEAAAKKAKEIEDNNQKVTPALLSSVEASTEAARHALEGQKVLEDLKEQAIKVARMAARDEIAGTLKALRKAAHDKAKVEGEKKAKILQAKMLAEAPKAGKAAMAPYNAALGRAAATAGEYTKRADGLSGASVGLQMQSGLLLGEANQLTSLGEVAKAQAKMQEAHATMNLALALSGQAGGFYNAAKSIMGTLGAYAAEGVAADYHAQFMLNPDLPPPPPPMV